MESVYTVRIAGMDLTIYSTESADYTNKIARDVNAKIKENIAANPSLSVTTSSLLVCMDLYDEIMKLQSGSDNMRAQVKEYLDSATRALAERDEARRTADRLAKELEDLKKQISKG